MNGLILTKKEEKNNIKIYRKNIRMEELKIGKGYPSLYLQIKDIFKNKIMSEELNLGDKIPSEIEIQKKFNVSRITARQAILELEKEGMVKRGRGKGTFVIWQKGIEEDLSHIKSFTEEMISKNRVPGTKSLTINKVFVTDKIAKEFGMDHKEEMYCVKRVRTADDVRLVYFISYFPLSTNLPMDPSVYKESIYEMLDYTGAGIPAKIEEKISAVMPDEEVCTALNIASSQPVLLRERISFSEKGELMEFTHCYYRGDMYKYRISTTEKG